MMTDENSIKEAFTKVKNDIFSLGNEIYSLKGEILTLKQQLSSINEMLDSMKIDIIDLKNTSKEQKWQNLMPKTPAHIPTDELKKPANSDIPTDTPTVPMEIGGLKYPNFDTSIRNRGVPTDRQTNQQTDNYAEFYTEKPTKPLKTHLEDARDILDSLDAVKKEIRLKFKQMTNQEMLIFSTIYQLEEAFPEGVEYKQIALKLRLSESSIRDYAQKLINKGIPVDKVKLNNKKILLKISPELKKIASLPSIIKLREL